MDERPVRGNLPAELSSFVGRGRELSQVHDVVSLARLVTLTGTGGVGKTRLALRVAHRVRRAFPDGVWLVELAALEDAELLASTVAVVLGMADQSAGAAVYSLTRYLGDKRLLLVLDNCEHVADGCAALVDKLLTAAPQVRVLATSRQPLRVQGEHLVVVGPLSVPDPERLPVAGDLGQFEAVRLLIERVQAAVPGFALTAANRAAIAGLCARLGGIPLAIELAAARLRTLSVQEFTERLDDQLRLLSTRSRAVAVRHRSLQAALDGSHALCSPAEQVLWARVSVFAGGFDLEAAERVCGGGGLDPGDMLELVAGLVDQSVLVCESPPGPAARYGLSEPVRQYGRQLLVASGQESAVRRRHRDYYRDLARRAWADFFSPRQVEWMLRVDLEHSNLRLAVDSYLSEPNGGEAGLEMVVTLRYLWINAGRHREVLRSLSRALALHPQPDELRGIALANLGHVAAALGESETARRTLAEARALADRLDNPYVDASVADDGSIAAAFERSPDLCRALDLAEQAVAGFRAVGDLTRFSIALMRATQVAVCGGDPRAVAYAEEHLALCEAHDARHSESRALANLALVRWRQGDCDQAEALLCRALRLKQLLPRPWGTGICLEVLAWVAAAAGRHERAAQLLGACHTLRQLSGAALAALGQLPECHTVCEDNARRALGATAYTASFDRGAHLTLEEAISYALDDHEPKVPTGPAAPRRNPDRGPLTRREHQIAGLIAQGLTNSAIATQLVISRRTVESHIDHIMAKLGFTNRTRIAAWAAAEGYAGSTSSSAS